MLFTIFEVFFGFIVIIFTIPTLVFIVECLAASISGYLNRSTVLSPDKTVNYVVLIPAHDEGSGIGRMLNKLMPEMTDTGEVLVVADNCDDDTADISKTYGINVIERKNEKQRGKGYALDFGIEHLKKSPPDVVVIMDADCWFEESGLSVLVNKTWADQTPIQATYLLSHPGTTSMSAKISQFAMTVKNLVRPLGLKRLGGGCQLMGTGMSFPWDIINKTSLASGNIVEDIQIGIDLTAMGYSPIYCPEVRINSYIPDNTQAQVEQRKRWEHGHLDTIIKRVPELIFCFIKKRDWKILSLALDLCVPPLALLTFMLLVIFFISIVLYGVSGNTFWPILLFLLLFVLLITIITSWYRFGRKDLTFVTLLTIPIYIVRKIPIYLSFIFKRQKDWIRTRRDDE